MWQICCIDSRQESTILQTWASRLACFNTIKFLMSQFSVVNYKRKRQLQGHLLSVSCNTNAVKLTATLMYILACSVHLHLQIYSIKMERSYCYMGGANSFHASEFSCILATAFVLQLNQFCSICPIWPLLDSRYGKKVSIHSAGPTSFGFKKLVHSRPLFLYVRFFKAVYNTVER